ncbi:EAL domain-containing protein [Agrobacterium salinitolerans]|nr:EAL domain-containing protein [Agrobacterium salinitolerans]
MDFLTSVAREPSSLLLVILFATVGSILTVDFMSRVHRGNGISRLNWLFIIAIICGTSSWATQVLALQLKGAAIVPGVLFLSLIANLAFSTVGLAVALRKANSLQVELGGAIVGFGNIVCLNLLMKVTGIGLELPAGFDGVAVAYIACVCMSAGAFSVAVRTNRRSTLTLGSALMLAVLATLIHIALPSEADAIVAGPWSAIVIPSVVVIMSAVLATALATYNIEHQSRVSAIEALRNYTIIDSLTGLSNRDALKAHISGLIDTTDRTTAKFAVMAFNLNRFRLVNDVHGSEAGDHILKTVANRLQAALGPNEFVARVSGDEFYAVTSGIHRKADAVSFANKMLEIVREPIQWKNAKLDITARIGAALFPNTSDRVEELIGQADIAMCRAQTASDEEVIFFDPTVDKAKRDLNALSIDLRKAIDDNEFEIYYQPQHSATTRQLIGFEALIRWHHPLRGMVSPADFIPLAEKTGMIHEIGAWVIREACLQAARWDESIKVAVNVSANQIIRNDLPEIVSDAIARAGIDPRRLELEITESGIVADERHALAILNRIKGLGCSIAMDDFGTGFSSLSTFKKFPFDKIKIDRAFISDLATNRQSNAIVNATVGVGRPLNIRVLAEGVEDKEQLAILTEIGCDEVQGFFFGRPVPAEEADALLRAARKAQQAGASSNVVEFKVGGR